jgi:hypothetical protein
MQRLEGHFSQFDQRIVFELLGKNAEADSRPADRLRFQTLPSLRRVIHLPLRTDERGRVDLGPLAGIENVKASLQ